MTATLWAKVWKWVCSIGAALAALGALWLAGKEAGEAKGKVAAQKAQDEALGQQAIAAQAQQQTAVVESRNETDAEIQKLPDAPAQQVVAAAPGTAAGKLRDEGWTRN